MLKRPDKDAEDAEAPGWRCRTRDYLWRCQNDYSLTPSRVLRPYLSNNKRNIHLCRNILWRGYNCLNIIYKIYRPMRICIQKRNIPFFFVPELTIQWSLIQVLSSATRSVWNWYLANSRRERWSEQTTRSASVACVVALSVVCVSALSFNFSILTLPLPSPGTAERGR